MKFGCDHSSNHDQTHVLRQATLLRAGCERIFTDTCSGSVVGGGRLDLQRLCEQMRREDVLVVLQLDFLSRNLKDLLSFINDLEAQGAHFLSLTENMDTTTPMGNRVIQMFGA